MKKKSYGNRKWNLRCILCLLPSFLGIAVFFLVPYLRVLYYSMVNNQFQKKFVWFRNYQDVLQNDYFLLALKNSFWLILIGVPALMLLSLVLSLSLSFSMRKFYVLRDLFVFPMMVPTAAIVMVWQNLFSSSESALPIYALFVWKNLGICVILLTAALTTLDDSFYEAARLDGAGTLKLHLNISVPLIVPTFFFTLLLAIMNSFKIFKESFLFYGGKYPPEHSYTLQFFMNNNFLKFNYPSLASASILTSLLALVIVFAGLSLQRRVQS